MGKVKPKEVLNHPLDELEKIFGVTMTTLEDYQKWYNHLNQVLILLVKYYNGEIERRCKHKFLQAQVNCLMMCIQNVRYWMRNVAEIKFDQDISSENDFKLSPYLRKFLDKSVLDEMTEANFKLMTNKQAEALFKIFNTIKMFETFCKQMIVDFYKMLNIDLINKIAENILINPTMY